jgi:hypothetical protein
VDKRLAGIANLLSYSSKLMVIKSVIAAMAIFAMSTVMVHFTILDHFKKSCNILLWDNRDIQMSGKCLASWDNVCRTKNNGGLISVLKMRASMGMFIVQDGC